MRIKSFKSLIFRALKFCCLWIVRFYSPSLRKIMRLALLYSKSCKWIELIFAIRRKILFLNSIFEENRILVQICTGVHLLRHIFSSSIFNSFSVTFQPTMQALSYFHPYPILVTLVIYYQSDISAFITVIEILHIFLTKINSFLETIRAR